MMFGSPCMKMPEARPSTGYRLQNRKPWTRPMRWRRSWKRWGLQTPSRCGWRPLVDSLSEHSGGPENHDPSFSQLNVCRRLGISASPRCLLFHHEFAETAHEKVLPSFKRLLANLEELLHDRAGLTLAQPHIVVNITDDLVFGQRHSSISSPRSKGTSRPRILERL